VTQKDKTNNHTAAFAEAFFIGNLLFVGVFYLALWTLYLLRYKNASVITQNHLKQTLVASSISTTIFYLHHADQRLCIGDGIIFTGSVLYVATTAVPDSWNHRVYQSGKGDRFQLPLDWALS